MALKHLHSITIALALPNWCKVKESKKECLEKLIKGSDGIHVAGEGGEAARTQEPKATVSSGGDSSSALGWR